MKLNIIEESPIFIRKTAEYDHKVQEIKRRVSLKYQKQIENESNALKRFVLKCRKLIEIKRLTEGLTSRRNLYQCG